MSAVSSQAEQEATLNGYSRAALIDAVKQQVERRNATGEKVQVPGIGFNRSPVGMEKDRKRNQPKVYTKWTKKLADQQSVNEEFLKAQSKKYTDERSIVSLLLVVVYTRL